MVSIIIPTYNRANTLKRCIISILEQEYNDFEIIIVDDCSNDNSEEVVKSINDPRITYIKHEINKGANEARNTGIKYAKGQYIAFQDSDDEWRKDKLKIQMQELQRGKADIVACSFKRFLGEKVEVLPKEKINDEDAAVVLPRKNYISTQTIVGKAECFKENLFDDSLPRFQDWELVIRLAQKYKIHFIEQPLVNVYVQEDSITKKPEKAIIALERIMNKHKDIFDNDPKAKAGFYILLGDVYMQMDNYNECYYTKALRNDMFNYKTYIRILLFYYNKIVKLLK